MWHDIIIVAKYSRLLITKPILRSYLYLTFWPRMTRIDLLAIEPPSICRKSVRAHITWILLHILWHKHTCTSFRTRLSLTNTPCPFSPRIFHPLVFWLYLPLANDRPANSSSVNRQHCFRAYRLERHSDLYHCHLSSLALACGGSSVIASINPAIARKIGTGSHSRSWITTRLSLVAIRTGGSRR